MMDACFGIDAPHDVPGGTIKVKRKKPHSSTESR